MQKRRRVVKVIILCAGQGSAKEEGMKEGCDGQQTKARNSGAHLNHPPVTNISGSNNDNSNFSRCGAAAYE